MSLFHQRYTEVNEALQATELGFQSLTHYLFIGMKSYMPVTLNFTINDVWPNIIRGYQGGMRGYCILAHKGVNEGTPGSGQEELTQLWDLCETLDDDQLLPKLSEEYCCKLNYLLSAGKIAFIQGPDGR